MRKSSLSIILCLFLCIGSYAQEGYTILLSGASFAEPNNRWFELGCKSLNATAINRAIPGEAIANTANRMADSTLYTSEEFDNIDALVLMQVHERDVFHSDSLQTDYQDYTIPFTRDDYAAAFDYVIKRYMTECYNLRNNPKSRYYNTPMGKPAVIVLCTHWHDARKVYNTTVRQLAEKWGLPVVEFDKYIGFSCNTPHPATGEQHSLLHAHDTEVIDGIVYGWHPRHGDNSYIQQRMAAIFADTMRRILYDKSF
jgi:hypothetical protein